MRANRWWIHSLLTVACAAVIAGCSSSETVVYLDADGDTFGDAAITATIKGDDIPTNFVTNNTDCNDSAASANPDGTETCDTLDNDCDGNVDDGLTCPLAAVPATWDSVQTGGQHHFTGESYAHSCAISDGTLWCWGHGGHGQLGNGSLTSTSTPTQVGAANDWLAVSASGTTTCGIRGSGSTGDLYCWGSNRSFGNDGGSNPPTFGILGLGDTFDTTTFVPSPTRVGTDSDWEMVDVGGHHVCGLRNNGTDKTVWCWGRDNSNGALGGGVEDTDSNEPQQEVTAATNWAQIDSGFGYCGGFTNAIKADGTLWHWGCGGPVSGSPNTPTQVGVATDWSTVDGAPGTVCGLKTDGTIWCFVYGNHGESGLDDFNNYSSETQVGTDTDWAAVDTGRGSVCAIKTSGDLYCWGRNHHFTLGLGGDDAALATTTCTADNHGNGNWDCGLPEVVDSTQNWSSVSAGRDQKCAINDSGALYCWGGNSYGEAAKDDVVVVVTPDQV